MAITRKKEVKKDDVDKAAADFIGGAPDAPQVPQHKAIKTLGRKSIITLSINPDVLARLDAWAKAHGLSRAAAVSFAVSNLE
jgi:hypothetical protein